MKKHHIDRKLFIPSALIFLGVFAIAASIGFFLSFIIGSGSIGADIAMCISGVFGSSATRNIISRLGASER